MYVYTYLCTQPLKTVHNVFPFTVPTCTGFAVLQHPDSTHFWIFVSPALDRTQSLYVFLVDMCFPTRHDGNIAKAQLCLEYSLCTCTV